MSPIRLVVLVLCTTLAAVVHAANPIQIENAKPGSPEWSMFSEAQGEIEGYASATSVNQGESISFFVNTTAATYNIDIFRTGWYGGAGARRVAPTVTRTGIRQVIPTPDPVTGLIECNWTDPYTITIPNDWVSGAYVVKLTTLGMAQKNKYILFVVREDHRVANHNFQLAVATGQAYNAWGGKSLYNGSPQARKVSFNRPYTDGSGTGIFLWRWEYAAVRFLEREGYDLVYTTNIDTHRRGGLLLNAKSFLSIGHDEYWSWEMRANVEAARNTGVNLGFFSANTCYWQVRFEPSSNGAPDRTMVGYKEAALMSDPFSIDSDPSNDHRVTTLWRNAPVNRPEAALLGVQFITYPVDAPIVIDDVTSAPWVFAETGLVKGSSLPGLLGYEVDAMNEFTPAGTIRLGNSPFFDEASHSTRYSHMTIYQHANGAWVFATGSIQWAWGLDDWNSSQRGERLSPAAQQMTRNILRQFAGTTASADCQYTLSSTGATVGADAGSGSLTLSSASHCAWTIASSAAWLTVTSGTSGSGNRTINYSYTSNSGSPARAATLTIGDKTFTLQQQSGCAYSLSPTAASLGAAGGGTSFTVTTTAPCAWSAASDVAWLTFSPASGFGTTTVDVTVAANEGPSRDGSIEVNGGPDFDVHQSNGCVYTVQPLSVAGPASGMEGDVAITTHQDCFWNASTTAAWIGITAGSSGRGSGAVSYILYPNDTGAARTGTISAAGVSVTVRQSADDCLLDLAPLWASYTSAAATGTIDVTSDCPWTATVESGAHFVTITATTTTSVTYGVAANGSAVARSASIRIGGRTIHITQNGSGQAMIPLAATATSTSSASLSWPSVSGATSYEVYRSANGSTLGMVATTSSSSYRDNGLTANRTYLYRVRAVGSTGTLAYSNIDPATTIMFVDPDIVPHVTHIKAVHILQLRDAVNAMRAAGMLSYRNFTDPTLAGRTVKANHVAQLRTALSEARAAIGLPPLSFSHPSLTRVRASHVTELRAGVQ